MNPFVPSRRPGLRLLPLLGLFALAGCVSASDEHDDGGPAQDDAAEQPTGPGWTCDGRLTEAQVRTALGRHGGGIFGCAESAGGEEPVDGVLDLYVKVGADGAPEEITIHGPLSAHRDLVGCVRDDVATWRFDPPDGGACATVHAPFAFGDPRP